MLQRKSIYCKELTEDQIWLIWDLDEEYEKFTAERALVKKFLERVCQIDDSAKCYLNELEYTSTQRDLKNFEVRLVTCSHW